MTNSEGIAKVSENLQLRAQVIVEEGHSKLDILKSAFADFKSLGSLTGVMAVMQTGKLNSAQLATATKIAVKVLAVLGMQEAEKGAQDAPKVEKELP